jgi:chitosanase
MAVPYSSRPAKSHELLDGQGFTAAWATEAGKVAFQTAQKNERDRVYWNPALAQAKADGVGPLGLAELYDISVNHGPGTDSESFGGIVAAAAASSPPPSKGGSEVGYLKALNTKRAAVLTSWGDNQPNGRDEAFLELINSGNLSLTPPVSWHMYGTAFSITTNPTPR